MFVLVLDYVLQEFEIERLINIRLGNLLKRKYLLLGKIEVLEEKLKYIFELKKLNRIDVKLEKIIIEYEKVCNKIKYLKRLKEKKS